MTILLNNKQIAFISPINDDKITYSYKFKCMKEDTVLEIRGSGSSDGYGMTISNVRLYEDKQNN